MDLSKLTSGQKIVLAAGVVLIINLFLPWYRVSLGGFGSVSANAFDAGFLAWAGSFLAIIAAVLVAVEAFTDNKIEIGNFKGLQLALGLAGLGTIFIILRLLTETSNLFLGIFLGIIAAGAATYGCFMAMKEAGVAMPSADDFKSITGGDDDGGGDES